jgi:hypothetical protein
VRKQAHTAAESALPVWMISMIDMMEMIEEAEEPRTKTKSPAG